MSGEMRIFILAAVVSAALAGGGFLIYRSHSDSNDQEKTADATADAAIKYAKDYALLVTERYEAAADKEIVVLNSDVVLDLSDATLVADTQRVLTALRFTPKDWTRNKMASLLESVDSAGCVPCSRLIEAVM